VDANINQCAPALELALGEHAPGGDTPAAHVGCLAMVDLAHLSGLYKLAERHGFGLKAHVHADLQHLAGLSSRLDHFTALGQVHGDGLFTQHVRPGLQRGDGGVAVGKVRCGHGDGVQVLPGQHFPIVLIGMRPGDTLGGLGCPPGNHIAQGHHLNTLQCLVARDVLRGGDPSGTDHADPNRLHARSPACMIDCVRLADA